MEFGQLTPGELEKIAFRLPKDPTGNEAVLKAGKGGPPNIYLGCAKWGRKEWVGKIYPPRTPEKDFLKHYVAHYNSIELTATKYKIYTAEEIDKWAAVAKGKEFIYCPKAHRVMSFLKNSPARDKVTEDFFHSIRHFGKHLGPVFITHEDRIKWDAQSEKEFFDYLASLPSGFTYFVEERWPGFFADSKMQERYYQRLREMGVGAVITDTAGRQDVLHMHLTIPKAFIRFVGNSLHPSDYPRIDHWAARLKKWIDEGIEDIYFFMHMHNEGLSPELTQYVVESFNKTCQLNLPPVKFVTGYKK